MSKPDGMIDTCPALKKESRPSGTDHGMVPAFPIRVRRFGRRHPGDPNDERSPENADGSFSSTAEEARFF